MLNTVRQTTVVKKGGRVEILSPELPEGSIVEVFVILGPAEQDATEYLLFTEANRKVMYDALEELEKRDNYVYVNLDEL
jgi:antitoxin YefM